MAPTPAAERSPEPTSPITISRRPAGISRLMWRRRGMPPASHAKLPLVISTAGLPGAAAGVSAGCLSSSSCYKTVLMHCMLQVWTDSMHSKAVWSMLHVPRTNPHSCWHPSSAALKQSLQNVRICTAALRYFAVLPNVLYVTPLTRLFVRLM